MATIKQRALEIEAEFDEPVRDVVSVYADMGFSISRVAEALDVSVSSLKHFASSQRIGFRSGAFTREDRPGRPPRPVRHNGREKTIREWAEEFGISYEGARLRLKSSR